MRSILYENEINKKIISKLKKYNNKLIVLNAVIAASKAALFSNKMYINSSLSVILAKKVKKDKDLINNITCNNDIDDDICCQINYW